MKKNIKLIVLNVFIATTIASCGLFSAPKYKKPQVNLPQKWQNIVNESFESMPKLAINPWWQSFNDPTLNELLDCALANNEDIQMAIGRINIAKARLQQVHMLWVPTIGLTKQGILGGNFADRVFSNNPKISQSANSGSSLVTMLTSGFVPSYSLNIFNIIEQQDYAKLNLEDTKYIKNAVRLSIIGQVIGSYISVVGLEGELYQQHKLIKQLQQITKLAHIQYKDGYISLSQLNQYEQQLASAKMSVSQLEDNINKLNGVLHLLSSTDLSKSFTISKMFGIKLDSKPIPSNLIPHNVPSGVLADRPDVSRAETELRMANADIGVARSNFFPNIKLTTPLGFYYSKLGSLFSTYGGFWSGQISSNMPILNLGLYALIKEKKAQYYVSYFNYVKTVKNAFVDTNDALVSHDKVIQEQADFLHYYKLIKQQSELAKQNYKSGYSSYFDYLINQLSLNDANIKLIKTKLDVLQSTLNVYQAMAAGYNYNNSSKPKNIN